MYRGAGIRFKNAYRSPVCCHLLRERTAKYNGFLSCKYALLHIVDIHQNMLCGWCVGVGTAATRNEDVVELSRT